MHRNDTGRDNAREHSFVNVGGACRRVPLAPLTLTLVMLASNDRALMGRHTNRPLLNLLGWLTTAATTAAAMALVVSWLA